MRRQTIEEYNKEYLQDALERMNKCDTACTDLGNRPYQTADETLTSVEWLKDNLPGFGYVIDRMVDFIFSDGLTTGEEKSDERLNDWLYATKNRKGATNYAELRQCVKLSLGGGECGLREYKGNIYHVPFGYYGKLVDTESGLDEVVAYYVRKDKERVTEEISKDEWEEMREYGDVLQWFDDKGLILLDTTQFIVIKRDVASNSVKSPLLSDKQRIDLLTAVYDQLNYDIRYDGPGRLFFFTDAGYAQGGENDISTGEVLANTPGNKEARLKKAKDEVRALLEEMKHSSSDSVGVLSGLVKDDALHLPRVTKATEFLAWLDIDTVIMAQVLGMSPTLLEVGELHGNVSVEKIIDNSMLNTIIPKRELYATQFSEFIARIVNAPKVYFDKYNMAQIEDENDAREKLAVVIRDLSTAAKASESEDVRRLIDEVSEVLRSSLYDDNGALKKV